ncbi:hypothetical protein ACTFIU_005028 [Dictyostelium citrinum]
MTVDVKKALNHKIKSIEYNLTRKDVALYAISLGFGKKHLKFVYEGSHDFSALPTIGIIFPGQMIVDVISEGIDGLEFDPMMLLHGEQELEILNDIPVEGVFVTESKITNLYDKGKGALLILQCITSEKSSGKPIFKNIFSFFIRGIGGFGGDRGPNEKPIPVPKDRAPDAISKQTTSEDQAVLYRLAGGDLNPLHIDPEMSKMGGFKVPILHGLCTYGIASRGVLEHFCDNDPSRLKSIKTRFTKHVYPGETIETEMWKINPTTILFQSKTSRDGSYVLSSGVAIIDPIKKGSL